MLSSTNQYFLTHTGTDFFSIPGEGEDLTALPPCSKGSDGFGEKKRRTERDSLWPLMKTPLQLGK